MYYSKLFKTTMPVVHTLFKVCTDRDDENIAAATDRVISAFLQFVDVWNGTVSICDNFYG